MMLDTTFLVDLLRQDADARDRAAELEAGGEVAWVPAPALYELWEGVERAEDPPREMDRVERVLEGYTWMSVAPTHAIRAGRIAGRLIRRGEMLDPLDVLVAGMAIEEGHAVLTRNVEHFSRVRDLDVESY